MSNPVTLAREGNCGLITILSPPVNALSQSVRSGLVEAFLARGNDNRARKAQADGKDTRGTSA